MRGMHRHTKCDVERVGENEYEGGGERWKECVRENKSVYERERGLKNINVSKSHNLQHGTSSTKTCGKFTAAHF